MMAVAAAAAIVGAAVTAARKNWFLSRRLARVSVAMCIATFLWAVAGLIYGFGLVADADASSQATLVAEAISTGIGSYFLPSVLLLPLSFIAGVILWGSASRRLRSSDAAA